MPITSFDHINVRTANLDQMIAFYGDVLGLHAGKRPNFSFPGAWLSLDGQPIIHLVGTEDIPVNGPSTAIEHAAFRATDIDEFTNRLKTRDIAYSIDPVPGLPIVQVNFHDPDGNHIHVDFGTPEAMG